MVLLWSYPGRRRETVGLPVYDNVRLLGNSSRIIDPEGVFLYGSVIFVRAVYQTVIESLYLISEPEQTSRKLFYRMRKNSSKIIAVQLQPNLVKECAQFFQ